MLPNSSIRSINKGREHMIKETTILNKIADYLLQEKLITAGEKLELTKLIQQRHEL